MSLKSLMIERSLLKTRRNKHFYFNAREKKTRKGLNSLSCFQAHEKKTRKGLFFNLRLRKASKPLRERV